MRISRFAMLLLIVFAGTSDLLSVSAETIDVEKEKGLLITGRSSEQQDAMRALSGGGAEAARALCNVIESEKDPAAKARAGSALQANLRNPANQDADVLSCLERLASGKNGQEAGLAATAAMQFKGNSRAREILRNATKSQVNEQRRAQILGAFVANIQGDKAELPFVRSFLEDKSEYVRVNAAGYLGSLGDKTGLKLCETILNREPSDDATRMLQMRAAIAAGRIGDQTLVPVLRRVASSKDYGLAQWQARLAIRDIELKALTDKGARLQYLKAALAQHDDARWAVQNLMAIGDSDAIGVLTEAAHDKKLAGSQEADRALAVLQVNKK